MGASLSSVSYRRRGWSIDRYSDSDCTGLARKHMTVALEISDRIPVHDGKEPTTDYTFREVSSDGPG